MLLLERLDTVKLTMIIIFIMFNDLMSHPYNRYFKSDDDIVYIHPGTFRKMIEGKNSCECFMHFANTVTII